MPRIITLTTDFGLSDSFVGAMKGVLLTRCPGVQVIDVCHLVPPQGIAVGALRLASAAPYFPPGSVHLAVVDPEVGGPRRAIALTCGEHFFVGPDNGVLSLAAPRSTPGWRAVELTNRALQLPEASSTFHGRDIFAPAAAHLAGGGALDALGEPLDSFAEVALPRVANAGARLEGVVLDVDRFGNLVTNIRPRDLEGRSVKQVLVAGLAIEGLSTRYEPSRPLVALFNSDGWLEISAPGASAALRLAAGPDTPVIVQLARRGGARPRPPS